ncbi:hypothetical protein UlMin_007643 [Ulmus minor]
MNKYKKPQLLNNLLIYSMTALTCTLCSYPFWFPSLCSSMKLLLSVYVPKACSVFFSSKFVFILGNLIVFALIGESKIFSFNSSRASQAFYEEYISRSQNHPRFSAYEEKKEKNIEERKRVAWEDGEGKVEKMENFVGEHDEQVTLPTGDLSKRADDFIARVNKQRRFEARELLCYGEI